MSDFDDLDALFGPLRSDATPAELASEQDIVALMTANHTASKGTTMFTSRRARVATLIAAGIIGFGGVVAASPAAYDLLGETPAEEEPVIDDEVEVDEVEVEEVEEPAEEPAVEPAVEEKAVVEEDVDVEEKAVVEEPTPAAEEVPDGDDPDTPFFDEANDCEPGNHGATVSAAARGSNEKFAKYEQRDVARSSCGKMDDGAETDDEVVEEPEAEVEEEPTPDPEADEEPEEVEQPAAPSRGKSDQAPGQGGGKSNNGNGKKGD